MSTLQRPISVEKRTREIPGASVDDVALGDLIDYGRPVVLKGVARNWPLVRAGLASPQDAIAHILSFYRGRPVVGFTGEPAIRGRFHYNEDATAMNFRAERVPLDGFLARIADHLDDPEPPSFYIGSTDLDEYLPGFRDANDLAPADGTFAAHPPLASIWIGNRTVTSAHYDMSNNAAVCAVGHRRFTLFPPDQIANLYPGPLDPTPGGQVVSMVDFTAPDLGRFPGFADAVAAGEVAELEQGDLLVYPALWWHHVEALDPFNVLVNYWWNAAPDYVDAPTTTLLHAMLSLRDRPAAEKEAWRAVFDYYVFGDGERAAAHVPPAARGPLAPLDAMAARQLRARVMSKLNR